MMVEVWKRTAGLTALLALAGRLAVAQVYYIDLSGQALAVPDRTFYIREVLDGRSSRAGVGTVLRGMGNLKQRAELKPSVPAALQALLTAQLPARPTDQPVLAVVRAVLVQEKVSLASELASDDLALDFYLLDAAGQAHFVLSTSETVESRGLETTARHPRQLAQALQACLLPLTQADWGRAAAQPGVAPAQLLAAPAAPLPAYPVLADTAHPAGYYRTFLDFRRNAPVTAPALLVEAVPNPRQGWGGTYEYQPYLQLPGGGRGETLRGAWGFSDGRQLYIWHRRGYRLLVRQPGGDFNFVSGGEADPGAVSTGALLGGALGAGIAAASTSGQPTDYTLHLLSGRVTALAGDAGFQADTVQLYIYSRRSSRTATPQPVYLNGAPVGQLGENQLVVVPYTDKLREVRLRLGTAPELVLQPDFQGPVYVKVRRKPEETPSQPPLEVVTAKTGAFDLRLLRPAPGTD